MELSDLDLELDKAEAYAVDQVRKAEQIGEDRQRIEFFDVLRSLIIEKETAGDKIAVEVLCWAYERIAETD